MIFRSFASGSTGNLYTVTLDVEPEDLLDWDKPLSEQSEKVKAALAPLVAERNKASEQVIETVRGRPAQDAQHGCVVLAGECGSYC